LDSKERRHDLVLSLVLKQNKDVYTGDVITMQKYK